VSAVGYDFGCAIHTYAWDFGDGGRATEKSPSHRYTTDGVYHVKVHMVNGSQPVDLTGTVTIVGGTPVIVIPPRHRASH